MDKALRRVAAVVAVLLAMSACWWLGRMEGRRSACVPDGRPDTVTVTKWVAAPIPEPVTGPVLPKLYFLPVHDTTAVHDTAAVRDSVLVEVPIEEKTFPGENYIVTIRGFEPELVDIWIRQDEKYITQPYRKRWSLTAGPQVDVGITPDGWRPYAGLGVTFGYSF